MTFRVVAHNNKLQLPKLSLYACCPSNSVFILMSPTKQFHGYYIPGNNPLCLGSHHAQEIRVAPGFEIHMPQVHVSFQSFKSPVRFYILSDAAINSNLKKIPETSSLVHLKFG